MRTRRKQPRVTPAKALDWLRRTDDLGEKTSDIARTDGYDPRTVRKKTAEARELQDRREARQMAVRSALERHFAGICSFAKKFRTQVSKPEPEPISLTDDPLWRSLREHLQRSPIWPNVEKLAAIQAVYNESAAALRKKIEKEALRKSGIPFSESAKLQGIYDGWFDGMLAHAKSIARGDSGLTHADYRLEKASHGIRLDRGSYTLALTSEQKIPLLEKAFDGMLKDIEKWPEYEALKKNTGLFIDIRSAIQDELTTVILRRVVPGRCHYCPY